MKIRIKSITVKVAIIYFFLTTINLSLICMVIYENQIDLITQNTKYRVTEITVDLINSLDKYSIDTTKSVMNRDETVKEISSLISKKISSFAIFTEQGTVLYKTNERYSIKSADILAGIKSITSRDFAEKRYYTTTNEETYEISFYIPLRIANLENSILLLTLDMKDISILLSALYRQIILLILIVAALHFAIGLIFYRLVIAPMKNLHSSSVEIAAGNLSARVNIQQDDEIGELGSAFNMMAASIQEHIVTMQRQEKANKAEMDVAGDVQKIIFPELLNSDRFHFGVFHRPYSEVSGDYYDIFAVDGGKTGFLMVDVSGHGVPAALLTMLVRQMFKQYAHVLDDPATLFKQVNSEICEILNVNETSIYFTAFYCVIDAENNLSYCKAGHLHQYLIETQNKKIRSLNTNGFIVGISDEMNILFETKKVRITPGDKIVLLTDGIVEAGNKELDSYGEERFEASMLKNYTKDPDAFITEVMADLSRFIGTDKFKDDATILVIEVK